MALRRSRSIYTVIAAILLILLFHDWEKRPGNNTRLSYQEQSGADNLRDNDLNDGVSPDRIQAEGLVFGLKSAPYTESAVQQNPSDAIIAKIPFGTTGSDSKIQFNFNSETESARQLRAHRLQTIKEAFLHSWTGYHDHAWLKDELAPVTGGYRTTLGGWAVTLVDSLDTLWILGLKEEFEQAVNAITNIDFNNTSHLPINVFETTIRYLGGLVGAYDLTDGKYPILLRKAVEVGEMLYGVFDTPTQMPVLSWSKIGGEVASGNALVAELGSLSLEFTRLSQLTGESKFFDAVQRITDCFDSQQMQTKAPGLFPHIVNARECDFTQDVTFSLGGSADSMYEYFPKQFQLLNQRSEQYKRLYERAIGPIKEFVLFKPMTPNNADILLSGTLKAFRPSQVELIPQMQHLACFAGGMLGLAAKLFDRPDELSIARKLVNGCIWAYQSTATGIMPEIFHVVPCPENDPSCTWDEEHWGREMLRRNSFDENPKDKLLPLDVRLRRKSQKLRLPKGISAIGSRDYQLRPEAIESIFVLYRITGDERLREDAWTMFEAITNQTRTNIAFSAIDDVTTPGSRQVDKMESFWTAETLKYFYLLFENPDVVSLDEYVFNTEAHPFRLPYSVTLPPG